MSSSPQSVAAAFFGGIRRIPLWDLALSMTLHSALWLRSASLLLAGGVENYASMLPSTHRGASLSDVAFTALGVDVPVVWVPTAAYMVYLVATALTLLLTSGHLLVGPCATGRALLALTLLAYQATTGTAIVSLGERSADSLVGVVLSVALLVIVVIDIHTLFDGFVGVEDLGASLGMQRCPLCRMEWERRFADCGEGFASGGDAQQQQSLLSSSTARSASAHNPGGVHRCRVLLHHGGSGAENGDLDSSGGAVTGKYGSTATSRHTGLPTSGSQAAGISSRKSSVFPCAESVGFASRWTFSWMNSFIHFAYQDTESVFADPAVAAKAIPPLPSFMHAAEHYHRPNVQLWRRLRLFQGGNADDASRSGNGDDAKGSSANADTSSSSWSSTRTLCNVLSTILYLLLWPLRFFVLSPLKRLGKWLFLQFYVDEVTRHEILSAPYRSLWTLFLETEAGRRFVYVCVPLKLCQDLLASTSPVMVSYLIHYIKAINAAATQQRQQQQLPGTAPATFEVIETAPLSHGLLLCLVMFLLLLAQTLFFQNYLRHLYLTGTEAAATVRTLLLEKILATPLASLLSKEVQVSAQLAPQRVSEGAVIALMTVDAGRLGETLIFLHNTWGHPVMVTISLALLTYYVGVVAAVSSLLALLVMLPVNRSQSGKVQAAQAAAVGSGPRVALSNEVFSNMRFIKANVWEGVVLHRLLALRREESKSEENILTAEATASFFSDAGAIMVSVVCFSSFYLAGGVLSAETLVPALAALNLLRFPIWSFPSLLSTVNRGLVSMRKLDAFLGWSNESAQLTFFSTRTSSLPAGAIECTAPTTFTYLRVSQSVFPSTMHGGGSLNATVSVGAGGSFQSHLSRNPAVPSPSATPPASPTTRANASGHFVLDSVVLRVTPGELMGIRGGVGAGKTSLLLAILGELAAAHSTNPSAGGTLSSSFASSAFGSPLLRGSLARRGGGLGMNRSSSRLDLTATMDHPVAMASPHHFGLGHACGFRVGGSVVYCSDTPWLRNESIRKNICMHLPFESRFYAKVVKACALQPDLARLSDGDLTVIGDKGVQLSGGQRARVALARAVYGRYDIYLLDGVLDALDEASQQVIIQRVLHGLLKKKTRLVVSHVAMDRIRPDRLVEVRHGGSLVEVETHARTHGAANPWEERDSEGNSRQTDSPASSATTQVGNDSDREDDDEEEDAADGEQVALQTVAVVSSPAALNGTSATTKQQHGTTVKSALALDHQLGRAKLPQKGKDALKKYVQSFGWGGVLVLLTSTLYQTLQTSMDVWFGFWISRRISTGIGFLVLYAGLGAMTAVFSYIRTAVFFRSCVAVSNRLIMRAVSCLLSAPVSYFDVAASGTITSILSKDADTLDRAIPDSIRLLIQTTLQLVAIVIFNSALSPMFLVVIPFTVMLFFNVSLRFLAVSKEVRKLENRSIGGVAAILKETYQGAPTIRCNAGFADEIRREFCAAIDVGNRARDVSEQLDRWVGLRLELVSTTLATAAAFISVIYSDNIPPAFAGVAVVNCLNTSRILLMLCRRIGMFQVQFMSIEQIMKLLLVPEEAEYLTVPMSAGSPSLHQRSDHRVRQSGQSDGGSEKSPRTPPPAPPPSSHPAPLPSDSTCESLAGGAAVGLELQHLSLRYRVSLADYALKDVCLSFGRGCSIGLVGRSGSGKTTLFNALLGLADVIEATKICFGPHDVTHWRRRDVRRRCLIVPQEPPLLKGTWRSNLRLGLREAMELPCTLDALEARAAEPVGVGAAVVQARGRSSHRSGSAEDQALLPLTHAVRSDSHSGNGIDHDETSNFFSAASLPSLEDEESRMLRAVAAAGLFHRMSPLLGLDSPIEENGQNFSSGEKQLMCLARALMRDPLPEMVLLDEVSSHVDEATDEAIQSIIRSHFSNCTTIMIAHRLTSLRHCDYVVSLCDGRVTNVLHRSQVADSVVKLDLE